MPDKRFQRLKSYLNYRFCLKAVLFCLFPFFLDIIVFKPSHLPKEIIWGILAGQILFIFSVLVTTLSFKITFNYLKKVVFLASYYLKSWRSAAFYLTAAFFEEVVWRVSVQSLLGYSYPAILITSLLFTADHWKKTKFIELFELFLFSCILGVCFYKTHSLILIVIIHAIRNVNSEYLAEKKLI